MAALDVSRGCGGGDGRSGGRRGWEAVAVVADVRRGGCRWPRRWTRVSLVRRPGRALQQRRCDAAPGHLVPRRRPRPVARHRRHQPARARCCEQARRPARRRRRWGSRGEHELVPVGARLHASRRTRTRPARARCRRLTTSMAVQLGRRGVRVNALAPGPVLTAHVEAFFPDPQARQLRLDRVPLGRFGRAGGCGGASPASLPPTTPRGSPVRRLSSTAASRATTSSEEADHVPTAGIGVSDSR